MGEVDYQMALLLQHRFEQENKSKKTEEQSDYELARTLQEQFEQEAAVESPSNSIVYERSKPLLNTSKSLTDPSWELVDPTPDIHALFLAFNQRYFWGKLEAVCVSWGKRMTSCAGICSYNGRGGMCSITLSEPLLKLRPRKDLVETLLHEMIHAFLFVTHNNRDRDGHGPEFHKHMYRINKESGTNITVYHTFHDEVRLYQQHWWRCNGPCQHWKPYFGMVRRAMNRAPGPTDKWWGRHSRDCGGTFIKVKEPEKPAKNQKKTENKTSGKSTDIRKFLPTVKAGGSSNVKGFKDLVGKVKGKSNSNSTIVVTKNTNTSDTSFKPTIFNKDATNEKTDKSSEITDDFLAVRNHWANKFSDTNKRPAPSPQEAKSSKISKSSSSTDDAECPICNNKMPMADINRHLDSCLNGGDVVDLTTSPLKTGDERKECPLCNKMISSFSFDVHVEQCLLKTYSNIEEQLVSTSSSQEKEKVACLACGKKIFKDDLKTHLDECMQDIFGTDVTEEDKNNGGDDQQFNCPFCLNLFSEEEMKEHIDNCLNCNSDAVVQSLTDDDF